MSDSSESYHEPVETLSRATLEMHRALASLREELEAVDWYRQRMDACSDRQLREILAHNMREEIEHASMLLAWLRGHDADFTAQLDTYLGSDDEALEAELREARTEQSAPEDEGEAQRPVEPERSADSPYRFTIGSLKEEK